MENKALITEMEDVRRMLRSRREDAHKGDFGHALLACGSRGMAGAAVLAAMGALRSGCGLVTVHMPELRPTGAFFRIALKYGAVYRGRMRVRPRTAS